MRHSSTPFFSDSQIHAPTLSSPQDISFENPPHPPPRNLSLNVDVLTNTIDSITTISSHTNSSSIGLPLETAPISIPLPVASRSPPSIKMNPIPTPDPIPSHPPPVVSVEAKKLVTKLLVLEERGEKREKKETSRKRKLVNETEKPIAKPVVKKPPANEADELQLIRYFVKNYLAFSYPKTFSALVSYLRLEIDKQSNATINSKLQRLCRAYATKAPSSDIDMPKIIANLKTKIGEARERQDESRISAEAEPPYSPTSPRSPDSPDSPDDIEVDIAGDSVN
jgi:hypothetical protein